MLTRRTALVSGAASALATAAPTTATARLPGTVGSRGPGERAMLMIEEVADALPNDANLLLRVARGVGMTVQPCGTGFGVGLGEAPQSAAALILGWAGRIGRQPIREALEREAGDARLVELERVFFELHDRMTRLQDEQRAVERALPWRLREPYQRLPDHLYPEPTERAERRHAVNDERHCEMVKLAGGRDLDAEWETLSDEAAEVEHEMAGLEPASPRGALAHVRVIRWWIASHRRDGMEARHALDGPQADQAERLLAFVERMAGEVPT